MVKTKTRKDIFKECMLNYRIVLGALFFSISEIGWLIFPIGFVVIFNSANNYIPTTFIILFLILIVYSIFVLVKVSKLLAENIEEYLKLKNGKVIEVNQFIKNM